MSPSLESSVISLILVHWSCILAWGIPWTEEPVGPQSRGWQRVEHNGATNALTFPSAISFIHSFLQVIFCHWCVYHFFWNCQISSWQDASDKVRYNLDLLWCIRHMNSHTEMLSVSRNIVLYHTKYRSSYKFYMCDSY